MPSRGKDAPRGKTVSAKTGNMVSYHNAWVAVSRHERYNHQHYGQTRKYVSLIREEPHQIYSSNPFLMSTTIGHGRRIRLNTKNSNEMTFRSKLTLIMSEKDLTIQRLSIY